MIQWMSMFHCTNSQFSCWPFLECVHTVIACFAVYPSDFIDVSRLHSAIPLQFATSCFANFDGLLLVL